MPQLLGVAECQALKLKRVTIRMRNSQLPLVLQLLFFRAQFVQGSWITKAVLEINRLARGLRCREKHKRKTVKLA
jgi:hypothetical protein